MTFEININASDGVLSFAHQPGAPRPLRLMSAPSPEGRLLGLFLEESWNHRPLELLDAVAHRQAASWNSWTLQPETEEHWSLSLSGLRSTIPDWRLRYAVRKMAASCLTGIRCEPTASESEVPALEHRQIRLRREA